MRYPGIKMMQAAQACLAGAIAFFGSSWSLSILIGPGGSLRQTVVASVNA